MIYILSIYSFELFLLHDPQNVDHLKFHNVGFLGEKWWYNFYFLFYLGLKTKIFSLLISVELSTTN